MFKTGLKTFFRKCFRALKFFWPQHGCWCAFLRLSFCHLVVKIFSYHCWCSVKYCKFFDYLSSCRFWYLLTASSVPRWCRASSAAVFRLPNMSLTKEDAIVRILCQLEIYHMIQNLGLQRRKWGPKSILLINESMIFISDLLVKRRFRLFLGDDFFFWPSYFDETKTFSQWTFHKLRWRGFSLFWAPTHP